MHIETPRRPGAPDASRRLALWALALAYSCGAPALHAQAALTDPGSIGGYTGTVTFYQFTYVDVVAGTDTQADYAQGFAVSGDGNTLVGAAGSPNGFAHAFAWTASRGIVDLGTLGGAAAPSIATAASNDGSVVVGFSETTPNSSIFHSFAWTAGKGMVDLGVLPGSQGNSIATGVSADGTVIVGGSNSAKGPEEAFRWTQSSGMTSLSSLNTAGFGPFSAYNALGVSADGNVVVGWAVLSTATGSNPITHAYRWTSTSGLGDLGTLNQVAGASAASAANSDGSVVVGASNYSAALTGDNGLHAFRWTASVGMVDLGTIGNVSGASGATGVSNSGAVVVGSSAIPSDANISHAFVWTQQSGMQDLNTLLVNGGVKMSGVTLTAAHGVSSDGAFVVGDGIFPGTGTGSHAYIARIGSGSGGSSGGSGSGGDGVGVTTPQSLINSIAALFNSLTAQTINNQLLASVLLGVNEQLSCSNCGGASVSFGSFTVGTHGRRELTDEWTVLGGISYGQYKEQDANVTSSWTLAGSLRFDPTGFGASRPFAEVGVTASPGQQVTYRRSYANGSGTAFGIGETRTGNYAAFGRVGWIDRLTRVDEVGAYAQLTREWQTVSAYTEAANTGNPFAATVPGGTNTQAVVGVGAQYTHLFGKYIEANVNAGVARALGAASSIDVTIAGYGDVRTSPPHLTWETVGGRLGWRVGKRAVVDLFADAVVGPQQIGHSVHGGVDFNIRF